MHLSFQKVFYVLATVIGLFAILILAKSVIIPIAFAFLIAFILFPVARKFEYWGANEKVSALLSILGVLLIIGGAFFFSQIKSSNSQKIYLILKVKFSMFLRTSQSTSIQTLGFSHNWKEESCWRISKTG